MGLNNELRQEWQRAGYPATMGSAAVVAPPPPGFLRVYYVTKAEHAVSAVALGRVKVARFGDLNDPFELLAANLSAKATRTVVGGFRSSYADKRGLVCFSRDWTNPVLWGHYGDKHRGVALGFDIRRTLAHEVTYDDERLLAAIDESDGAPRLPRELRERLLTTKYSHWHYEEEVRMFVTLVDMVAEGQLHFRPFDDDLRLAEVVVGPECTLALSALRNAVDRSYESVAVFGSRLAYKRFKVVPRESTVP